MTEPKKLYHSISEVSERLGVKPHVLRYWESQFRWLRPKKNRAGNRSYQEKDLVLLEQIRELLYDRRFTIEGARKELDHRRQEAGSVTGTEGEGPAPSSSSDAPASTPAPASAPAGAAAAGTPPPDSATARRKAEAGSEVSPHFAGASSQGMSAAATSPGDEAHRADGEADVRRLRTVRAEILGLKEWLEGRP